MVSQLSAGAPHPTLKSRSVWLKPQILALGGCRVSPRLPWEGRGLPLPAGLPPAAPLLSAAGDAAPGKPSLFPGCTDQLTKAPNGRDVLIWFYGSEHTA